MISALEHDITFCQGKNPCKCMIFGIGKCLLSISYVFKKVKYIFIFTFAYASARFQRLKGFHGRGTLTCKVSFLGRLIWCGAIARSKANDCGPIAPLVAQYTLLV